MLTFRNQKSELPKMNDFVNHFFGRSLVDELFNDSFTLVKNNINIVENENSYDLSIELPGFSKNDINIEVDNDLLTVSSVVEKSEENKDKKYIRKSFSKSSFKRNFQISDDVDKENIVANMENGILNIVLNKLNTINEKPKMYKIEIK